MVIKEINYKSHDWERAVRLREKVLREPLGSTFSKEELDAEKEHVQVAGFIGDHLIATAVLVPEDSHMKMQRVAVLDEYRNKNIGSQMMVFCEALARSKGVHAIYCHARDSAVNFYRKNNYNEEGDYFDEDGIPHLKMIKKLN